MSGSDIQGVSNHQRDPGSRAYEDVIAGIRDRLNDGALGPGDALPSERRMSEDFGVSRHSVREAIRVLQEQGVLATRHGSGNYVRATTQEELTRSLLLLDRPDARKLFEVFQLRELIEPQIAGLAAQMIKPYQLEELDQLIRKQVVCTDISELKKIDVRFHALLSEATGNKTLAGLMDKISETLNESRIESHQSDERRVASVSGHCRILAALRSGDSEASSHAMHVHINDIKKAISHVLDGTAKSGNS